MRSSFPEPTPWNGPDLRPDEDAEEEGPAEEEATSVTVTDETGRPTTVETHRSGDRVDVRFGLSFSLSGLSREDAVRLARSILKASQ